jgi:hypothetical protein
VPPPERAFAVAKTAELIFGYVAIDGRPVSSKRSSTTLNSTSISPLHATTVAQSRSEGGSVTHHLKPASPSNRSQTQHVMTVWSHLTLDVLVPGDA